jgi:CheY-like chemotaxis protein
VWSLDLGLEWAVTKKALILIVDDEPGPREALRFLLRDEYKLLFAENGKDTLREIRQMGITAPVIIMTAFPDRFDQTKARALDVTEHFIKPFDLFDLQEKIREALCGGPGKEPAS